MKSNKNMNTRVEINEFFDNLFSGEKKSDETELYDKKFNLPNKKLIEKLKSEKNSSKKNNVKIF
jgi:hypothetical protein